MTLASFMLATMDILTVPFQNVEASAAKKDFYISKIDSEIFSRIKGKSYKDNCPLPLEDLRYLHLLHKDLNGNTVEGELSAMFILRRRYLISLLNCMKQIMP